jgi:hypothetical protein
MPRRPASYQRRPSPVPRYARTRSRAPNRSPLRYSPRGGVVELMRRTLAGGVRLVVRDDGSRIPAYHRRLVFERFSRSGVRPFK